MQRLGHRDRGLSAGHHPRSDHVVVLTDRVADPKQRGGPNAPFETAELVRAPEPLRHDPLRVPDRRDLSAKLEQPKHLFEHRPCWRMRIDEPDGEIMELAKTIQADRRPSLTLRPLQRRTERRRPCISPHATKVPNRSDTLTEISGPVEPGSHGPPQFDQARVEP